MSATGTPLKARAHGLVQKVEETASSIAHARPLVPATQEPHQPVIPFTILDGPSQRAYAVAIYVALWAWRLYDWSKVLNDDADSLLLFMKWTVIDGIYMYGLPGLRIPWLEWSGPVSLVLFVTHAILNWFLMFGIPIPFGSWLVLLTKLLYDRELAVSERKVNPAGILRDSSLILGKHTIHILPEGSAVLNPHAESYCLSPSRTSIDIPIRINQTVPVLIELTRIDLFTNANETLVIPAKQVKALKKQADRQLPKGDISSPRYLQFHVKQTGFYKLQKVVDESGLEVQRISSDALVVVCPSATVKPAPAQKCRGELSNLVVQLHGTPPFKLKYSRTVNREDKTFSFQSIQPENFVSPLKGQMSDALVTQSHRDLFWARPHQIDVPLNESLNTVGHWLYSIDEVHDALGNSANYSHRPDDDERVVAKRDGPQQIFSVDARPRASLSTHESPCQLKVARGRSARLPLVIDDSGQGPTALPFTLLYRFTPTEELQPNGEHSANASVRQMTVRGAVEGPLVHEPGLYTLLSVSSRSCSGEVLEPTSCLLINPPEPSLSVVSTDIYDTCAGNPIGLQVDLDLIGTPPFRINYETYRNREKKVQTYTVLVEGLRHQLEFKPSEAGHYIYRFKSIKDSVYDLKVLSDDSMVLRQDVKPPASARFAQHGFWREACLDENVPLNVTFQGEGPWDLEYEVVHNGKRQKHEIKGIEDGAHEINIDGLNDGGEYTVALVSVHDSTRCKVFLKDESKIDVRRQRPKAGFGKLEGKRTVVSLQGRGVPLPVRLTGQAPWTVKYRHSDSTNPVTKKLNHNNDHLEVSKPGTYELIDVRDAVCPGVVDESASTFTVEWLPRPSIKVSESAAVDLIGGKYIKKNVCEGDEDATEITLTGTPPYYVKYQQRVTPQHGSASISNKELTAGLGVASVHMETRTPGIIEYRFTEVADNLYDADPRDRQQALMIQQRVNPKPTASFTTPGKTYKFCKEESPGEEIIPLTLTGTPPFYLEMGIKHHRQPKPEVVRIPNIQNRHYDFRIPHRLLAQGSHTISIRKIRDSHNCLRTFEPVVGGNTAPAPAPHVLVHVADAPSISPLEANRRDYCVGDWIEYHLSGTPPFTVFYTFRGTERKATSSTTNFRRIAESPGDFTIIGIADQASGCRAKMQITKVIHSMPSVRISKGRETKVDIHEGGTAEIVFDFQGEAPFEFTYIRTAPPTLSNDPSSQSSSNKNKNKKHNNKVPPRILETKTDISQDMSKTIRASEEGTYEAIAIKDRWCGYSKVGGKDGTGKGRGMIMGSSGEGSGKARVESRDVKDERLIM